jgi:hypothetical protein
MASSKSLSLVGQVKLGPIPTVNFTGKWKNELKSEMELTVLTNGSIAGTYRTNVGSPKPSEEFDLVGFASGDLISFAVNFGAYGSLTAWVGQHTLINGTEVIETLWHLAENVPDDDEPSQLWSAILTGADNFTRA